MKGVNILLAVLVLAATGGFSVNKHYCQDKLVGIAFLDAQCCETQKSAGCCSEAATNHCGKKDDSKGDCCEDETDFYKLDEQFTSKTEKETASRLPLVVYKVQVYASSFAGPIAYRSPKYLSGLIVKDIPVLIQSFRC